MDLPVKVVTSRIVRDFLCDKLILPTIAGAICVLKNHINFITILQPGSIKMLDKNNKPVDILSTTKGGLFYVRDGHCFIVADQIAKK